MEIEAPAHHRTVLAAAARNSAKKRPLDEVAPPAFVVDDEGVYDIVEMPKRFVLSNRQQHDKFIDRMAAFHAMDVRVTASLESVHRSAAAVIQRLRAQEAARAAAGLQAAKDS